MLELPSHPSPSPPPPSPVYVLRGHSSPVNSVKFLHSGTFLLSGTTEGEVKLWNVITKRCAFTTKLNEGIVKLHEFDGTTIVSQDTTGNLSLWSLCGGTFVLNSHWNPYDPASSPSPLLHSTTVPFAKSAIDSSTSRIAMAVGYRENAYVDILDIRHRAYVSTLSSDDKLGLCLSMSFIPNSGNLLLCGGFENGDLRWWDLRVPDKTLPVFISAHKEPVLCFDIDEETSCGVSGAADTYLPIFTFDTQQAHVRNTITLPNKGIADIKIRGDKKIFVTAGWDNRIRVFSWKQHTPLAILRFHSEGAMCVDFPTLPAGEYLLAAGSKDKRISLWDIYNSK